MSCSAPKCSAIFLASCVSSILSKNFIDTALIVILGNNFLIYPRTKDESIPPLREIEIVEVESSRFCLQ